MTHISHGPTQHTPSPMPTPPPLPPRRPAQAYSLYNDRPFGSNYYGNYGNYGYGTGYRSYSGYNFLGSQMPYSDTYNYRYIDGQNIESRYITKETLLIYISKYFLSLIMKLFGIYKIIRT